MTTARLPEVIKIIIPVAFVIGPPAPHVPDDGPLVEVQVLILFAPVARMSVTQIVHGPSAIFCAEVVQLVMDLVVSFHVPYSDGAMVSVLLLQFTTSKVIMQRTGISVFMGWSIRQLKWLLRYQYGK